MAFPTVAAADSQSNVQATNATSWTGTWPTNVATNDLVLLFVSADGAGIASATDFTSLQTRSSGANQLTCLGKKAAGGETGTFTITISASEQGCWRTIRIPAATWFAGTVGQDSDSTDSVGANGLSATPDPPSQTPTSWGAEDTLWIALGGSDTSRTFDAFPTNYTQEDHTTAGGHAASSGGAGGAGMGVCYRQLNTATEDPGTFTISASDDWACLTVAVRPAAAAVDRVPHYQPMPPLLAQ